MDKMHTPDELTAAAAAAVGTTAPSLRLPFEAEGDAEEYYFAPSLEGCLDALLTSSHGELPPNGRSTDVSSKGALPQSASTSAAVVVAAAAALAQEKEEEEEEVDNEGEDEEDKEERNSHKGHSASQTGVLARMVLNPHKAGLSKVNADKVNQIVYEASKDSPFYQHQQALQKKLTARIDAMLAQYKRCRTEPSQETIGKVDRLVKQINKHRKIGRTIVHVDMDMFYAAVEMRDDPSLKDKPMAVGSIGMLTTANYIARQYGVRAAMPGYIGKKLCPDLVIVPNNHLKYIDVSKRVRTVFARYDPKFVPMSLDEAYLDITAYLERHPNVTAAACVHELRAEVCAITGGLTCSAGIAANRLLAKVCSDLHKPDGQTVISADQDEMIAFVRALPIRKIPGIGKVTEQVLQAIHIKTCNDMWEQRYILQQLMYPKTFEFLMSITQASGRTRSKSQSERQSISTERTFSAIDKVDDIEAKLWHICDSLMQDARKRGLQGRTVTLKLKTPKFDVRQRGRTFAHWLGWETEPLFRAAQSLLKHELPIALRLMGVKLSQLRRSEPPPPSTPSDCSVDAAAEDDDDDEEAHVLGETTAGAQAPSRENDIASKAKAADDPLLWQTRPAADPPPPALASSASSALSDAAERLVDHAYAKQGWFHAPDRPWQAKKKKRKKKGKTADEMHAKMTDIKANDKDNDEASTASDRSISDDDSDEDSDGRRSSDASSIWTDPDADPLAQRIDTFFAKREEGDASALPRPCPPSSEALHCDGSHAWQRAIALDADGWQIFPSAYAADLPASDSSSSLTSSAAASTVPSSSTKGREQAKKAVRREGPLTTFFVRPRSTTEPHHTSTTTKIGASDPILPPPSPPPLPPPPEPILILSDEDDTQRSNDASMHHGLWIAEDDMATSGPKVIHQEERKAPPEDGDERRAIPQKNKKRKTGPFFTTNTVTTSTNVTPTEGQPLGQQETVTVASPPTPPRPANETSAKLDWWFVQ